MEGESKNPEQAEELKQLAQLREVCEQIFPELGLVKEDIEKIFDDAAGDFGDALSSVYEYLLQSGENADEVLAGLGILESEE